MRSSRLLLERSVLWLVLGSVAWVRPGITLTSLTLLLGIALLIDGMLQLVHSIGTGGREGRWAGFVGIAQGVLSFLIRHITPQQVLIYLACWGIATGVIEIAVALREGRVESFWSVLAGAASLGFGCLLLSRNARDVTTVLGLIGLCALAFGVVLAVLALGAYLGESRRSNSALGTPA
ncbi:MAG TPA: DUF308 domain-containing protein [Steroidobacteraceae bacterium]|jgi:uncharacterized membrane protein HdeD (DUF308 family)|nr:DUF308 domain-containing protein [Steroidobacteraceae bacterium]